MEYHWYGWTLQMNGSSAILDSGTAASAAYGFAPSHTGTYTFYLNASDSVGSIANVTTTVTVEPALVATLTSNVTTTQVGGSVSLSLGFSGGVAPITYTLEAGCAGLEGDTFTPTAAGPCTIYLNASDAVGSTSDATVMITVEPALDATLSANVTTTQVGGSVSLTVGLSGGVAPVTYTLQASGPGLSGTTFTPTTPGIYTIYLNASDAAGSTSDATVTVTVESSLVATLSANVTTTQVGGSVSLSVGLSGGVAPITYTLQADCAGLAGDVFTPVSAGSCTIYLNATDAVGSTSNATVTITVEPALFATLTANVTTTQVGGSVSLSVGLSGGVEPVTYTLQAGCAGLTGDVFTPLSAGSCTIYLNATDAVGSTSNATVTITVEPALFATLAANVTTTQVGGSVSLSVGLSGGVEPVTYTLQAGCAGLTGDVFTPLSAGSCTIYLNATDAVGSTSNATVTITVEPALFATLAANVTTTQVGGSVSLSVGLSGGVEPVTYTLQAGCGGLAGDVFTPVSAGSCTIYLNATDAVGSTSDVSVTITVKAALAATLTANLTTTQVGGPVSLSVGLSGGVDPVTYTLQAGCAGLMGDVFIPVSAGSCTIYLNATDAVGSTSDVSVAITVKAALVASLSPPTATINLGGSVTSSVGMTGGVDPATYTLQASCAGLVGDVFTPTATGVCTVYLNATDAVGSHSDVTASVTVMPAVSGSYAVTFTESGLPSGTEWFVNITGGSAYSSMTNTISFMASNGGYDYTLGTANTSWEAAPGSFTVSGAAVMESVTFHPVTYSVTFTETGVPSGLMWYLNLSDGQMFSTMSSSISFTEPNGSYAYEFGATPVFPKYYSALAGSFTVNGHAVTETPMFTEVRQVIITEHGLPSGMEWWVNFTNGGPSFSSTGTTDVFYMPAGTWSYKVAAANSDYTAAGRTFTVHSPLSKPHAALSFGAKFKLNEFKQTFTEIGLPHGAKWCVVITGGATHCTTGRSMSFKEPNGTYTFTLTTPRAGYSGAPGWIIVVGVGAWSVTFTGPGVPAALTSTVGVASPSLGLLIGLSVAMIGLGLVGLARRRSA